MTLAVVALVAACSKGDDDSASIDTVAPSTSVRAPGPLTPAPCKQNRHVAVFDFNGTLTLSDQDAISWATDPQAEPSARPGAADLVTAYRQHGYEIRYLTGFPAQTMIAGHPVAETYMGWLGRHGFPTDGSQVLSAPANEPASLSSSLVALAGQGVKVDVAYTNDGNQVALFQTGGISKVFGIGQAARTPPATAVANDDLVAKVSEVRAEPKICS
jgi:hypothetical protein